MSLLTCFTDLDCVVLDVTNLTDCSLALKTDITNFSGGKSYLTNSLFLRDELCSNTSCASKLCALAGVKLDVVDKCTHGNVFDRESVTGLDVCIRTCVNSVACGKSNRSYDIALLSFFVLKKRNVCCSVGVVLDTNNSCGSVAHSLEIDNSVFDLIAAAVMTNCNSSVAVTACVLLLDNNEALFGS